MIQPTCGTPRRKMNSVTRPEVSDASEMPQRRTNARQAPPSASAFVRRRRNGSAEFGTNDPAGGYRTFAPDGRSRSSARRASVSPAEPASTMPFEVTPISVAGSRFATTTTFRPTSASGP
jgi:hypothetical protein